MKTILFISCLLTFFVVDMAAQTHQINKFYQQHRHDKGVINVSIPGWLIRLGAKVARKHTKDDPTATAALKMVKKFKTLRLLVTEGETEFPMASYTKMTQRLKSRSNFDDLIMIRSKDTNVNIMANGKKDKLKHLLFLVKDDGNFVMLSMRTKIKMKDFVQVINEIIRADKQQQKEEAEQQKKKRPQA